jgi:glycosyltransferase involved in cell wall biosynthesis
LRILIDYRPALRQRTGVGEYAHELAAALTRLLAPASSEPLASLPAQDSLVLFSSSWKDRLANGVVPGVPIVDARVPVTLLNLVWHRLEWPPIESFAGPVDVAHSMHPLLMPARAAARVVTIHDLYFLDHPGNTATEIRRDYPVLAADHARRADGIIAVSNYTASLISNRLAVDLDRIAICSPGAPAWAPAERPPAGGPILFMGTIEPRKNVTTLLRAYAELVTRKPDAPPLVLAGRVVPACQDVLSAIEQPPLAGRVRAVGYVSGAERERLYRDASVLVMPSLDEGFGMPAVEAMTIGLPVVVSDRGALPEVVGDAGLLIDPEDPGAIAAAIERVLDSPELAARLSDAGKARARRFTWDASAATLVEAYQSAIERRRARQ